MTDFTKEALQSNTLTKEARPAHGSQGRFGMGRFGSARFGTGTENLDKEAIESKFTLT